MYGQWLGIKRQIRRFLMCGSCAVNCPRCNICHSVFQSGALTYFIILLGLEFPVSQEEMLIYRQRIFVLLSMRWMHVLNCIVNVLLELVHWLNMIVYPMHQRMVHSHYRQFTMPAQRLRRII